MPPTLSKVRMPDCRRPESHRRERDALPGEAPAIKTPRGARTRSQGPRGPSQTQVGSEVLWKGGGGTYS